MTILPNFVTGIDYVQYDGHFTLIKTSQVFKNILATLVSNKIIKKSVYEVKNSKYKDSGHYYCVYSSQSNNYLIKSYWYVVHDGKVFNGIQAVIEAKNLIVFYYFFKAKSLRQNFNDHVVLEPCLDPDEHSLMSATSSNSNNQTNIVWTLNDKSETKFWVKNE